MKQNLVFIAILSCASHPLLAADSVTLSTDLASDSVTSSTTAEAETPRSTCKSYTFIDQLQKNVFVKMSSLSGVKVDLTVKCGESDLLCEVPVTIYQNAAKNEQVVYFKSRDLTAAVKNPAFKWLQMYSESGLPCDCKTLALSCTGEPSKEREETTGNACEEQKTVFDFTNSALTPSLEIDATENKFIISKGNHPRLTTKYESLYVLIETAAMHHGKSLYVKYSLKSETQREGSEHQADNVPSFESNSITQGHVISINDLYKHIVSQPEVDRFIEQYNETPTISIMSFRHVTMTYPIENDFIEESYR